MKFIIEAAQIELLAKCNFKCIHCSNASRNESERIHLGKLLDISKQLVDKGCKLIILSGGETLLYPDIEEAVSEIISMGAEVQINTNGLLIPLHLMWMQKYHNSLSLQVSLDGYNDTTNSIIRNNHSFDLIINNIKTARASGIKVAIATVLTKIISDSIYEFDELVRQLDCSWRIGLLAIRGRACDHPELILCAKEILDCCEHMKDLKVESIPSGIFKNDHCPLIYSPGVISKARITNEGDFYPCMNIMEDELSLGNLLEKNMDEILDDYVSFQKRSLEYLYSPKCLNCGKRTTLPRPGCLGSCDYFVVSGCKRHVYEKI